MELNFREGALFETLNARKMSSQEIASSFVISPQFDSIVGLDHSFLVGPRGSGKTTILRMLQGETLTLWQHPRASEIRSKIAYSSIFVPADRLWSSQLSGSTDRLPEVELRRRETLGIAAFGTQLLSGLIETLQYRLDYFETGREIHRPAKLSDESEVELVVACASAWKLKPKTRTLNGLSAALDERLLDIGSRLEDLNANLGSSSREMDLEQAGQSPMEAVRFGIRAINRLTGDLDHRWALLLDEMELAPKAVQQLVMKNVRGGERNLVLKMSFSPFDHNATTTFKGLGAASAHNDFIPVYLWSGDRRGGRKFADSMFRAMYEERIGGKASPFSVLGVSEIDASGRNWKPEDLLPGSKKVDLMLDMEKNDPSFREYLDRRRVNLLDLVALTYAQKSATLRKFFPVLVFRDALLRFSPRGPGRRSRKKVEEVFSGQDLVYAALEANPRWMKAVFGQMLTRYENSRSRIPYGFQYDALKDAAERFEALLELLPTASGDTRSNVLPLVNSIAGYFNSRVLGPFTVDFPTTFVVDEKVDERTREALYVALNAGAIVHVRGPKSPSLLSELDGERFRITYLLSIRDGYEVPLRLGKSVNLSKILSEIPVATGDLLSIFEEDVE